MKAILIILNVFIFNTLIFAQKKSVEHFIDAHRASGMSEKMNLTLSGWLVRTGYHLVEKTDDLEGLNLEPIVEGIRKLRIHVLEPEAGTDKNDAVAQKSRFKAVQTLLSDLRTDHFEDLAAVKDAKSRVNVLAREKEGLIEDIMILVHEAQQDTVLLQISGKFRLEDIAKILENQA
ncbi:MAG: hypothetical protein RLZZ628_2560, partial [Bacteroidota bacterium]